MPWESHRSPALITHHLPTIYFQDNEIVQNRTANCTYIVVNKIVEIDGVKQNLLPLLTCACATIVTCEKCMELVLSKNLNLIQIKRKILQQGHNCILLQQSHRQLISVILNIISTQDNAEFSLVQTVLNVWISLQPSSSVSVPSFIQVSAEFECVCPEFYTG